MPNHTDEETPDLEPWEHARARLEQALAATAPLPEQMGVVVRTLGEQDLLWNPDQGWWAGVDPKSSLLPVLLHDRYVLLGPVRGEPVLAPGCLVCLARRWQQLRPDEYRDTLEKGSRMRAHRPFPHLTGFALDTVCSLARALTSEPLLSGADDNGNRYVYRLDLADLRVERHPLLPDPQCPACAHPVADGPEHVVAEPRPCPKHSTDAMRVRSASEYRMSEAALLNPVCGALSAQGLLRLDNTTTAPAVGYVSVRGSGYLHPSYWGGHADTYRDSLRLGLLEGWERSAGLTPKRYRPSVRGTYRELAEDALDPRELGTYDPVFYEHNPEYQPFTEDTPLTWVWGRSLGQQRPILVPEVSVYYHGLGQDRKIVQECSNGCATGGSQEEATLHGLFERVERDAFLLAWYGRLPVTEIDAHSWRCPSIRWMVQRLALCGYRARFFDARIAFAIPVVIVVAERKDGGPGTLCFGAGASLDPEEAANSALREVAFEVPNAEAYATHSRERLLAMADDFRLVRELADHPRLYGLPEMRPHADHLLGPHGDVPGPTAPASRVYRKWYRDRPRHDDLTDDLRYCRDELARSGIDCVVVDQTTPEQLRSGVHTVCVLTPGLLPIDFGWDRQRALLMPRIGRVAHDLGRSRARVDQDLAAAVPHPFP